MGKIRSFGASLPRFSPFPFVYLQEREFFVEEQQIQAFVHAVLHDEKLRQELVSDPDAVIMREGFSPRLSSVIRKLVPYMEANQVLTGFVSPSIMWA